MQQPTQLTDNLLEATMDTTLELFTASSGYQSARVRFADGSTRHIHSTVKPQDESAYFTDLHFWGNVIVFTGTGIGYHLGRTLHTVSSSALLILVDYYDELLNLCRTGFFSDIPNRILIISPSTFSGQKELLKNLLQSLQTPVIQIVKHPASYALHRTFYDTVLSSIHPFSRQTTSHQRAATKALLLYGSFFLQPECRRALAQIFMQEPPLFNYEEFKTANAYESQLQKLIQMHKPDYVLSINMKGFDGEGILSTTTFQSGIPLAVWFVDDPHPILLQQKQFIRPHMIAACWERSYIPYLKKCGFCKVVYLPLATDTGVFSPVNSSRPAVSLGFVGSSMSNEFLSGIREKFLWSDTLQSVVEKASDELLSHPDGNINDILRSISRSLSIPLPFSDERNSTWLCSYAIHQASMKKRRAIISSLLHKGIELFGDPSGWRELFGANCITHPDLDYATQLAQTYRNIAVNINITSCQMATAVNQRVFDIPMAGSLVLSDNQQAMEEMFEIGAEAVSYGSREELGELISFYSNRDSARSDVITAAQRRIAHEHTYMHRMQSLITTLAT